MAPPEADPAVALGSGLRIADVVFAVTSNVPLIDGEDPEYAPFLEAAGPADVHVEVWCEPASPPSGTRLFDARSWVADQLPDGDVLVSFGQAPAVVFARFDRAVTRVRVTCAPSLLVAGRLPNPLRYPLDQILMIHRLAQEGGLLLHACAVAVRTRHGVRAVLCPGVSGAGKTTLASHLRDAEGLEVLSDDRAVVRLAGDGYRAWGTPWPGTGRFAVNKGLPLAAIAFIRQAEAAGSEPLPLRDAVMQMARVASVPWYDRELGPRAFDGIAAACAAVPTFRLDSVTDRSMAEVVRRLAG